MNSLARINQNSARPDVGGRRSSTSRSESWFTSGQVQTELAHLRSPCFLGGLNLCYNDVFAGAFSPADPSHWQPPLRSPLSSPALRRPATALRPPQPSAAQVPAP